MGIGALDSIQYSIQTRMASLQGPKWYWLLTVWCS